MMVFDPDLTAPKLFQLRLVDENSLETLAGDSLAVAIEDQQVRVGGAAVTRGDVRARNGLVHFVDRLVVPR